MKDFLLSGEYNTLTILLLWVALGVLLGSVVWSLGSRLPQSTFQLYSRRIKRVRMALLILAALVAMFGCLARV